MRTRDFQKLLSQVDHLTQAQREALRRTIEAEGEMAEVVAVVQSRPSTCPHCRGGRLVRHGQASGLQRYRCRGCGKTFNALTATPLARLRHKNKWLDQVEVMRDGLSVPHAAARLGVAPSTAFRWRHRFLQLPRTLKGATLSGVVEADETYFLRSRKGQAVQGRRARARGGRARKRGANDEHEPVLVVRNRSGVTEQFILDRADKIETLTALASVLAADAVLCTDGSGALAAAAQHLGIEHHALNLSSRLRVQGPWHIQNVNAYHSRLKQWIRRFRGIASSHLPSYLAWFKALDRSAQTPRQPPPFLHLAVGL